MPGQTDLVLHRSNNTLSTFRKVVCSSLCHMRVDLPAFLHNSEKESWRTTEVWHCEVPGKTLVKVQLQWQLKLRLSTMKRSYEMLLVKVQLVAVEDPAYWMPVPWGDQQQQRWQWGGVSQSLECHRGQSWRVTSPEDIWIPDIGARSCEIDDALDTLRYSKCQSRGIPAKESC